MKRKFNISLLILIIIVLFTVNVSSQVVISKEAVDDLEYLINRIEEVHPNIYFHLSKEEADRRIEEIKDKLREKEEWTNREIYKLFGPFVASFKDGHTGLYITDKFRDYYDEGGTIFPLGIKFINDKVMVYKNYSKQEIKKETELLAINGIKINEIMEEVKRYISSENSIYAYSIIERTFPIYLWALYDFDNEYELKLKDKSGQEYDLTVKGATKEARIQNSEESKSENWTLDYPFQRNAYLTINTFSGSLKNAFEIEMDKFFEDIRKKDINNLFIDISENGGGNTDLAKYLVDHFNDKPYSLFKEVRMKYSDYAFRNRSNVFTKLYYYFKKDRDNIIVFQSDMITPKENDLRFNGDVYIITSNFTFSTATDFAAIVKDHELGTIVGEETGGLASCYGDVIRDRLPNTELSFGVSYKYFLRPSGFDNGRGVKPDIKLDISELKYWYDSDSYKEMVIKSIIY